LGCCAPPDVAALEIGFDEEVVTPLPPFAATTEAADSLVDDDATARVAEAVAIGGPSTFPADLLLLLLRAAATVGAAGASMGVAADVDCFARPPATIVTKGVASSVFAGAAAWAVCGCLLEVIPAGICFGTTGGVRDNGRVGFGSA
jgi:hypothetical protein